VKTKKTKKKKARSKNPVLGWLCYRCYDSKSYKDNPYINAVSLKCSLCDEPLNYDDFKHIGGKESNPVTCTNGCGQAFIYRPECASCGERMKEYGGTLKDLLDTDPIDRDISLDDKNQMELSKKKSWWET